MIMRIFVSSTFHRKQVKHCGGGGLSEKIDFGEILRRRIKRGYGGGITTNSTKERKIGLAARRGI